MILLRYSRRLKSCILANAYSVDKAFAWSFCMLPETFNPLTQGSMFNGPRQQSKPFARFLSSKMLCQSICTIATCVRVHVQEATVRLEMGCKKGVICVTENVACSIWHLSGLRYIILDLLVKPILRWCFCCYLLGVEWSSIYQISHKLGVN